LRMRKVKTWMQLHWERISLTAGKEIEMVGEMVIWSYTIRESVLYLKKPGIEKFTKKK
jgi:hypothetical protein